MSGESPLETFGRASHFRLTIINEQRKPVYANIRMKELPDMIEKSLFARRHDLEESLRRTRPQSPPAPSSGQTTGPSQDTSSPAYSFVIRMGRLKGMTPVQALLAGKEAELRNQVSFLSQNIARYPNNQVQIDAIQDAFRLRDNGQLVENAAAPLPAASAGYFNILTEDKRPLIRNTRPDGKCLCYELKIDYAFSQAYPVSVEIVHYYAPVRKNENGTLNVLTSEMDQSTYIKNTMRLSAAEWMDAIYCIRRHMDQCSFLYAGQVFNDSSACLQQNMASAGYSSMRA